MSFSVRGVFLSKILAAGSSLRHVAVIRSSGTAAVSSFCRLPLRKAPSLNKLVAVLTLACFITSFIAGQAVAGVIEFNKGAAELQRASRDFVLPHTAGRITDARFFGSKTVVVNIQDLHCHPEVQRNISNILSLLDRKYHLPNVYLEGAFGQVDTSWLSAIGETAVRQKVLDSLLGQGKLTGVEYYSVTAGRPDVIRGIENKELYLANSRRLGEVLDGAADIEPLLTDIASDIGQLKKSYFNDKQAKLDATCQRYAAGKISAKKYYRLLKRYAAKLDIDINEYRDIVRYLDTLEQGRRINYRAAARQMQEFVQLLKGRLPYNAYNDLLRETENFSRVDELYIALPRLADEYKLGNDLNYRLPELARFFNYINTSRKINPLGLIREERKLLREIESRLATDQGEQDAAFLSDFFAYFKDYFGNRISADDYAYFRENLGQFRELWAQYIDNDKLDTLEPSLAFLEEYYRANEERNDWFLKNVLGGNATGGAPADGSPYGSDIGKTLASLNGSADIKVVVTGGFHTVGLAQLLAKNHISYLIITPNVTADTHFSDEAYARLAKEQNKILFQAFALLNLSQNPFPEKARDAAAALLEAYIASGLSREEVTKRINEYFQALKANTAEEVNDVSFGFDDAGNGNYPVRITYTGKEGKAVTVHFTGTFKDGKLTIADETAAGTAATATGKKSSSIIIGPVKRLLTILLIAFTLGTGALPYMPGMSNQAYAAPYSVQQQIPGTPLYRSFEPQAGTELTPQDKAYLADFANTYDQSLVVMSALNKGDMATVRGILNYYSSAARNVDGIPTKSNKEWEVNTGEVLWIGMAAAQYTFKTGDRSYENMMRRIDAYVLSQQRLKGYVVGSIGAPWASTEHNLDALAYLTFRLKITARDNDPVATAALTAARNKIAQWLLSRYNISEKRFNTGLRDLSFATDTSAWGVAVLTAVKATDPVFFKNSGLERIDLQGLLGAADARSKVTNYLYTKPDGSVIKVSEVYRFQGDNEFSPPSMEFSAQMALAYRLIGDEKKAQSIIKNINLVKDQNGSVPYALKEGWTFRSGGWQAHRWLSISATEWLGLAVTKTNPFLAIKSNAAVQPLATPSSISILPPSVIKWAGQTDWGANWRVFWNDFAPVDLTGKDVLVIKIKNAYQLSRYRVQVISDPDKAGAKGLLDGDVLTFKGGQETVVIPLSRFPTIDDPKNVTRVVITCGQTAYGEQLNLSNKNPVEVESIEFRKGMPQPQAQTPAPAPQQNLSLANRIGMAAFTSAVGWAVNFFVLSNPLVLLAFAPVAGYYLVQAAYLIRAEWRRGPPEGNIFERLAALVNKALSGQIRAAWVERGEVKTDDEVMFYFPAWLSDAIIAHEDNHLAFEKNFPRLSGIPILEEVIVSLLELPFAAMLLAHAMGRDMRYFLADERGSITIGNDPGEDVDEIDPAIDEKIEKWGKDHKLFMSLPPRPDAREKDFKEHMGYIRQDRKNWTIERIKTRISEYPYRSEESRKKIERWVSNLEESAAKKGISPRIFLTWDKGPLAWVLRPQFIEQVREEREKRLFGRMDIRGIEIEDLAVWPVNADGTLERGLIRWMGEKKGADEAVPVYRYYAWKKKLSLNQLKGSITVQEFDELRSMLEKSVYGRRGRKTAPAAEAAPAASAPAASPVEAQQPAIPLTISVTDTETQNAARTWALEHKLFLDMPPQVQLDADYKVDYFADGTPDVQKFLSDRDVYHWNLTRRRKYIMEYARKAGRADEIQARMAVIAENAKKAGKKEKDQLYPLLLLAIEGELTSRSRQLNQEKLGRLFGETDVAGMPVEEWPLFPLRADNTIEKEQLSWMAAQKGSPAAIPPAEYYYQARKASLRQLKGLVTEQEYTELQRLLELSVFGAVRQGGASSVVNEGTAATEGRPGTLVQASLFDDVSLENKTPSGKRAGSKKKGSFAFVPPVIPVAPEIAYPLFAVLSYAFCCSQREKIIDWLHTKGYWRAESIARRMLIDLSGIGSRFSFLKTSPRGRVVGEITLRNRLGIAAAFTGFFWVTSSLLSLTPLVWIAFVPVILYYGVQGLYLLMAAWHREQGKSAVTRLSVILSGIITGSIRIGWLEDDDIKIDEELLNSFPGSDKLKDTMKDLVLSHERAHLAFRLQYPKISAFLPDWLEEFWVSLKERQFLQGVQSLQDDREFAHEFLKDDTLIPVPGDRSNEPLPLSAKVMVGSDEITLERTMFPDGELYLRISGLIAQGRTIAVSPVPVKDAPEFAERENKKLVSFLNGKEVTLEHQIASANDVVEIVLLAGMLKDYGAGKVRLLIDRPQDARAPLCRVLKSCCDSLAYLNDKGVPVEFRVPRAPEVRKYPAIEKIDFVLFQHRRLLKEAKVAAAGLYAYARSIEINKDNPNPLNWSLDLPKGLKGKDVELIHSTENNVDFVELWLMLVALRDAGVRSISLINVYEGYSRADKIFKAGEGVNAVTMLKLINLFVDNHFTFNVHYGNRSGLVSMKEFKPVDDGQPAIKQYVHNLNAFCQISEKLFDDVVRMKGRDALAEELQAHPIVLVGPDKGSAGYVQEARTVLTKYIRETYDIDVPVCWGHLKKVRLGSKKVSIEGNVFRDDKPVKDVDLANAWIFVLDDEISWGSTQKAAVYALVRHVGAQWPRVLAGAVHGKLAGGLQPFETGLREDEIGESSEPNVEYVDEEGQSMPPRSLAATLSVRLPADFPERSIVPIDTLIKHATKQIIARSSMKGERNFAMRVLKGIKGKCNTTWHMMAAVPMVSVPSLDLPQTIFLGALLYAYACAQREAIIEWLHTKGYWRAEGIAAAVLPDLSRHALSRRIAALVSGMSIGLTVKRVDGTDGRFRLPENQPPSKKSGAQAPSKRADTVSISRDSVIALIEARVASGNMGGALTLVAQSMQSYDGMQFAGEALAMVPALAALVADMPEKEIAKQLGLQRSQAAEVKRFAEVCARLKPEPVVPASGGRIGRETGYAQYGQRQMLQDTIETVEHLTGIYTPLSVAGSATGAGILLKQWKGFVIDAPADVLIIGGGTGTSAITSAAISYVENTQSLICPVDNGGSSGEIMADVAKAWEEQDRQEDPPSADALRVKTVAPPGDFMSAIVAGIPEDWKRDFCAYRMTGAKDAATAAELFAQAREHVLSAYGTRLDRKEFDHFYAQVQPLAAWIDREWVAKGYLRIAGINHSVQNIIYLAMMMEEQAYVPGWVKPGRYVAVADLIVRLLGSRSASMPSSFWSHMEVSLSAKLGRKETLRIKDKSTNTFRTLESDRIVGQENITGIDHQSPIESIGFVDPDLNPISLAANPEVLDMISRAKSIVIGPGSVFTSILPHLLINGVVEELAKAKARGVPIVFLFNTTQDIETYHHTPQSLIEAMERSISDATGKRYSLGDFVSHVVFNEPVIDADISEYLQDEQREIDHIRNDPSRIHEIGKHTLGVFENTTAADVAAFLESRGIKPVIGPFADYSTSTGRDMKPVRSYRYALPLLAFFLTLLLTPEKGQGRCIATDVDETLCGVKEPISGPMARQIVTLLRQGHRFAIVTGNTKQSIQERVITPLLAELGADRDLLVNVPIVDNNGARMFVFQPETGEYAVDERFTAGVRGGLMGGVGKIMVIQRIIEETIDKFDIQPVRGDQVQVRKTGHGGILQITFVPPGLEITPEEKVAYQLDREKGGEKRKEYADYLNKRFGQAHVDVVAKIAGNTSIDITATDIDKARAVDIIADYFQVDPREVVFFGDSFAPTGNDYPASRKAGMVFNVGAKPAGPMQAKLFALPGAGVKGTEKGFGVITALGLSRPRQALGFSYRELVSIILNNLEKGNRGHSSIGELRDAAIWMVDYFISRVDALHGDGIQVLPENRSAAYAEETERLRQAVLQQEQLLRDAGVEPLPDNVVVKVARGKFLPVGHGTGNKRDLGIATMDIVDDKAVFYVTEVFLATMHQRAPPAIYELLARHELEEYVFLRDRSDSSFHDFHRLTAGIYRELFDFAVKCVGWFADTEALAYAFALLDEIENRSMGQDTIDTIASAAEETAAPPAEVPADTVATPPVAKTFSHYLLSGEGQRALIRIFQQSRRGYLALADMDKLRDFNSFYGKQVINFMIEEYLNTLHAEAQKYGGFAIRWGGDEWIFYLPPTVEKSGEELFEQLRKSAAKTVRDELGVATVRAASLSARQLGYIRDHVNVKVINQLGGDYIILFKIDGNNLPATLRKISNDTGIELALDEFNDGWVLVPHLSMGGVALEDIDAGETASHGEYLKTARDYLGRALDEAKKTRDRLVYRIIEQSPHTKGTSIFRPGSGFSQSVLPPIAAIPAEDRARSEVARLLVTGKAVTVLKVVPSYRLDDTGEWGRFKDINSTYGYLGGDEMIQLLYHEVKKAVSGILSEAVIARTPPDEFILCGVNHLNETPEQMRDFFGNIADRINSNSSVKVRFDILALNDRDVWQSFGGNKIGPARLFQRIDETLRLLKTAPTGSGQVLDRMLQPSDQRVRLYRYDPSLQSDITNNVQLLEKQGRSIALENIYESRKTNTHPLAITTSFDRKQRLLIPPAFRNEMQGKEFALFKTPDGVVHLLSEQGVQALAGTLPARNQRRLFYSSIWGTSIDRDNAMSFTALKGALDMSPGKEYLLIRKRLGSFALQAATPGDQGSDVRNAVLQAGDAVRAVGVGINLLNPGRIQDLGVHVAVRNGQDADRKSVVLIGKEVDTRRLLALRQQNIPVCGISLGNEGEYLFNVRIPVPGQERKVQVNVLLHRQEEAGQPLWILNLESSYALDGDELQQMLVLGRGALAVIDRLRKNHFRRKQVEEIIGVFNPRAIEMEGSFAAFANPGALQDKFDEGSFNDITFIFAADNDQHVLPVPADMATEMPRRYLGNVIEGEQIDVNKLGIVLADAVTGDAAVNKTYPELEGILYEKVAAGVADAEREISDIVRLYLPDVLNKRENTARPFGTVTEVVLPSALRKNDNDPGIGKLSDIAPYARKELEPAGATVIQLGPLAKPAGDSPFVSVDPRAGDEQLVDWMMVPEVRKQLKKGPLTIDDIVASENETDEVNRASVAGREWNVAQKAFDVIMAEPGRRAELERYEQANRTWLNAYVETMAASRIRGVPPDRIKEGDVTVATREHAADFERYAGVYRMTQWLFDLQLREALSALHAQGDKALCWIDITPDNHRQAELIVRRWMGYGFDGIRVNISADAGDREILNEAFIQQIKNTIIKTAPDAIMSLRLPKGADEALLRKSRELGFYNVRWFSDVLMRGQTLSDEWIEIDSPESLRPHLDPFLQAKFGSTGSIENFYGELAKSAALNGASYISFMIGTLCGDDVNIRWADENGDKHFTYRIPLKGDARYRLNLARKIGDMMSLSRKRTPESLYREGYVLGLEYDNMPVLGREGQAALLQPQTMELTGRNGDTRRFSAPGLYAVARAGAFIRLNKERGMNIFPGANSTYFFTSLYNILGSVPGMGEKEWPSGWGYLRKIEKQVRFSQNDEEKTAFVLQAAGFVRGMLEKMAEAEYRASASRLLPEKEQDMRIFRALLVEARACGISMDEVNDGNPSAMSPVPALLEKRFVAQPHLAMLLDILRGGSRDLDPEAALRGALGSLDGKDVSAAALYARALIKIRDEQGKTMPEIEAEVREILNPFYSQLLSEGMLSDASFAAAGENSPRWVASELLKLFNLFAEPDRFKTLADRTKAIYKLFNGAGVRGISSAG